MKLIHSATQKEMRFGDLVETFRGERGVLQGFTPPHKPSSTGKVYVLVDGSNFQNQWYPSVIGCEFVNN